MAREPELKHLFDGMDADEAEMDGYRHNLRGKLPHRGDGWFRLPKLIWLTAPLAAAALLVLWLSPWSTDPFAEGDVATFQQWAEAQPAERLMKRAQTILAEDGDSNRQWNAQIAMVVATNADTAIHAAADGLLSDPRAAGRAFHLEYLLDYGDEYRYNVDLLEARMDEESDQLCFDLFEQLLDLADVG